MQRGAEQSRAKQSRAQEQNQRSERHLTFTNGIWNWFELMTTRCSKWCWDASFLANCQSCDYQNNGSCKDRPRWQIIQAYAAPMKSYESNTYNSARGTNPLQEREKPDRAEPTLTIQIVKRRLICHHFCKNFPADAYAQLLSKRFCRRCPADAAQIVPTVQCAFQQTLTIVRIVTTEDESWVANCHQGSQDR